MYKVISGYIFFYGLRIPTMNKVIETFNIFDNSRNFSHSIGLKFGEVSEALKVFAAFIIVDFLK